MRAQNTMDIAVFETGLTEEKGNTAKHKALDPLPKATDPKDKTDLTLVYHTINSFGFPITLVMTA
jgi:hypothetical protein